jgi:hypothetical protein
MKFNPFSFLKRVFSSRAAATIMSAAVVVAQAKVNEKINESDFSDAEKELIQEGIRQFILELLSDDE